MRSRPVIAAWATLAFAAAAAPARAGDPNALWRVVHDLCVPDMMATGKAAPCAEVNLAGGYVVLKDLRGATQYLVVPTARISGIESPALLAPGPNYWQAAWAARALFEARVGRPTPREDIGLAVNSVYGRSQNQLHIHIDCVRPDVRSALASSLGTIGPDWAPLDVDLAGRRYRALWLDGAELGAQDPFRRLATGDPDAAADMGAETLVVIGARKPDGSEGFVALSHRADPANGDRGSGEDLLDHGCAVLTPAPGPAPADPR